MKYPNGAIRTLQELKDAQKDDEDVPCYLVLALDNAVDLESLKVHISPKCHVCSVIAGVKKPLLSPSSWANIGSAATEHYWRKDFAFFNYWDAFAYKLKLENEWKG